MKSRDGLGKRSVAEAGVVGGFGGFAGLGEGEDAALGEEGEELQEDLGGRQRVAGGGVAGGDGDAEAGGDGLERMRGLVGLGDAGEQQRVEDGVVEADAGRPPP